MVLKVEVVETPSVKLVIHGFESDQGVIAANIDEAIAKVETSLRDV